MNKRSQKVKILYMFINRLWDLRGFILLFITASAMVGTILSLLRLFDVLSISVLIEENKPVFVLFFSVLVLYVSAFMGLRHSRLAAYTAIFGAVIGIGYYLYISYWSFRMFTPLILIFPGTWLILCMPSVLLIISFTFSSWKLWAKKYIKMIN